MNLKDIVEKNTAKFQYYRDDELWYKIDKCVDNGNRFEKSNLMFPVPIRDLKGTTINAEEKAITLMKWIKRYLKEIQDNK